MTERYVHILWCDDIRLEAGNKPSFMGVYTAGIVLAELPAVLPRLGIYAWISTPINEPFKKLDVRIVRDDGFVVLEGSPFQPSEIPTDPLHDADITRQIVMAGLMVGNIEVPLGCRYFNVLVETESGTLEGPKLRVSVNQKLNSINPASSVQ